MKTVPLEVVEQTWQEIKAMPSLEAERLINRINKEQPVLLAYLLAAGEDIFSDMERELLLYLGMIIWKIMSKGSPSPQKVTEELLFAQEDANFDMLKKMGDDTAGIVAGTAELLEHYNQLPLFNFVADFLAEEDGEQGFQIREKNKGIMMIFLKTVIDCLNE